MRTTLICLPLMLLASPAMAADRPADPVPEEIIWHCALEARRAETVLCHRGGAGLEVDAALEDAPVRPDNHAIRQQLLANGGSNVGALVRGAPRDYGRMMWRIPLHAVPGDEAWLRLLVESVMCGSEPRCHVHMEPQRVAAAPAMR